MGNPIINDKILPLPGGAGMPPRAVHQRSLQDIGHLQKIMGMGRDILHHLKDIAVKVRFPARQILQQNLLHNFTPIYGHFRPMAKPPPIRYN